MEKIISVAIQFDNLSHSEPSTRDTIYKNILGRHCDLYETLFKERITYENPTEGFWTTEDRFVDRFEAYDIALVASQIINPEATRPLYSEDLW